MSDTEKRKYEKRIRCKICGDTGLAPVTITVNQPNGIKLTKQQTRAFANGAESLPGTPRKKWLSTLIDTDLDRRCVCRGGRNDQKGQVLGVGPLKKLKEEE